MKNEKKIMKDRLILIGHMGVGGAFGLPLHPENPIQKRLQKKWRDDKKSFGIPNDYPSIIR